MPVFCSSCDASNPRAARFCESCGAPLAAADPPDAAPRRPRARRPRHGHEIGSGLRAVRDVRAWFAALGAFCLLLFALLLLQLGAEDFEQTGVVIGLVLVGLPMAVCFAGVGLARRNPLPWALALIALLTLNVAWPLTEARFPGVLAILAMLSAWGLLAPILRLRRLALENADLDLANAAAGAPRPATSRRRARRNLLGDFRTAALLLVGFIFLLYGGLWAIGAAHNAWARTSVGLRAEQPQAPLAPALDRFEAAWSDGVAALQPLYSERLGARARRLPTRFDRRGLDEPLPALGSRSVRNSARYQQTAKWSSAIGDIDVVFEFEDGRWVMVALRLP